MPRARFALFFVAALVLVFAGTMVARQVHTGAAPGAASRASLTASGEGHRPEQLRAPARARSQRDEWIGHGRR